MNQELKEICLILTDNFPKDLIPSESTSAKHLFSIIEEKSDENAFNRLKDNIYEDITLYNVILSGHKTVEDAYGLLKSFLDYNVENNYEITNSNYPFFIFIENENLNKKKLYAYYLEQEKKRENLEDGYDIDSKMILFGTISHNVKERLNDILNYFHRKNMQIKQSPFSSPFIKIMFVGATGTGKSTMINELNGQKLSYSSSDNLEKTKDTEGGKKLIFKNKKYPILNQDTEGFEIGDITQKVKVNNTINKNLGSTLNERLHVVIYLCKNDRGLDIDDVPFLAKLHELKILYYLVIPKIEGKESKYQNSGKRLIMSLKAKFKNKHYDENHKKLFSDFIDKDNKVKDILIDIFDKMIENVDKMFYCVNILSKDSKGKKNLLKQIQKDLFEKKKIHEEYIQTIDQIAYNQEKMKMSISGEILAKDDKKYYKNIMKF